MKSVRLQLVVTLAAVLVAVGIFAARGLPPAEDLLGPACRGDLGAMHRSINWGVNADCSDPWGLVPLYGAIANRRRQAAKLLIVYGANVNIRREEGWGPLHWLAEFDDQDIAESLIAAGADVNARDDRGDTPLLWAIGFGRPALARLLVAKGASITAGGRQTGTEPTRPLMLALTRDDEEMVQFLVGAISDPNAGDDEGITPLHDVVRHGRLDLLKLLISKGGNIKVKDHHGVTLLHLASDKDIAELPVTGGADIAALDDQGRTPLHYAAGRGYGATELVAFLIDRGADVNARDAKGATPLHHLVEVNISGPAAELLLDRGAKVDARDNEGRTPLWVATKNGNRELAELLRRHGAKE